MSLLTFISGMIIAGAAVGTATYGAAIVGRFTYSALLYHVLIASIMTAVYYFFPGGFEKHFNRPTADPVTLTECGYYSMITHATVGYGDIYPKTTPSRLIVSLHVFLAFLGLAMLIPMAKTEFTPSSFIVGE